MSRLSSSVSSSSLEFSLFPDDRLRGCALEEGLFVSFLIAGLDVTGLGAGLPGRLA
jgi:hypothetical protein